MGHGGRGREEPPHRHLAMAGGRPFGSFIMKMVKTVMLLAVLAMGLALGACSSCCPNECNTCNTCNTCP